MQELLDERIANCRARYAEKPGSGVFVLLADLLRERGDYDEALAILADGLEHRPDSVAALVVMGRTLLEAGRAEDARLALQRVLELDADNLVALRLLSEDCRSRADWAGAVPFLTALAQLEPDDARWPAALEEARSYRDAPPPVEGEEKGEAEAGFATLTLVDIYMAQGYSDRAQAALEQMLEADPERADVKARLAILGVSSGVATEPAVAEPGEAPTAPEPMAEPVEAAETGDKEDILADPGEQEDDRGETRDNRKRQFSDWLDSLGQDDEASP